MRAMQQDLEERFSFLINFQLLIIHYFNQHKSSIFIIKSHLIMVVQCAAYTYTLITVTIHN
jgi:hypothetical protein